MQRKIPSPKGVLENALKDVSGSRAGQRRPRRESSSDGHSVPGVEPPPPLIQAETCGVSQARHYIRAALPLPLWLGLKGVSHVHFFIFKAGQRLDLV